jgi:hypothetical protein
MADPVPDPVAEHAFNAVAEPRRRQILDLLAGRDARYGEDGAGPPEWARVRDRPARAGVAWFTTTRRVWTHGHGTRSTEKNGLDLGAETRLTWGHAPLTQHLSNDQLVSESDRLVNRVESVAPVPVDTRPQCGCGCGREIAIGHKFLNQAHFHAWLSQERYLGRNARLRSGPRD